MEIDDRDKQQFVELQNKMVDHSQKLRNVGAIQTMWAGRGTACVSHCWHRGLQVACACLTLALSKDGNLYAWNPDGLVRLCACACSLFSRKEW